MLCYVSRVATHGILEGSRNTRCMYVPALPPKLKPPKPPEVGGKVGCTGAAPVKLKNPPAAGAAVPVAAAGASLAYTHNTHTTHTHNTHTRMIHCSVSVLQWHLSVRSRVWVANLSTVQYSTVRCSAVQCSTGHVANCICQTQQICITVPWCQSCLQPRSYPLQPETHRTQRTRYHHRQRHH